MTALLRRSLTCAAVALGAVTGATALASSVHQLSAQASLHTTGTSGGVITQSGTVTGSLGSGTMTQKSTLNGDRVAGTFVVRLKGGTVRGNAAGKITVRAKVYYDGVATITGGSGRYRAIRGSGLKFSGSSPIDGRTSQVSIRGTVRY